jgi:hypothetical protein
MNKNNELLLRGYSSAASHAESHVMNAVVNLQQGDHIYIRHREVSFYAVKLHYLVASYVYSTDWQYSKKRRFRVWNIDEIYLSYFQVVKLKHYEKP